jgi:hypothetical protein
MMVESVSQNWDSFAISWDQSWGQKAKGRFGTGL